MWTPYQINIVLHYHCRCGPWPLADAPIFPDTLRDLISMGLLAATAERDCYATTDRGKALVEMWGSTPLPEQKFVDPRFDNGWVEIRP